MFNMSVKIKFTFQVYIPFFFCIIIIKVIVFFFLAILVQRNLKYLHQPVSCSMFIFISSCYTRVLFCGLSVNDADIWSQVQVVCLLFLISGFVWGPQCVCFHTFIQEIAWVTPVSCYAVLGSFRLSCCSRFIGWTCFTTLSYWHFVYGWFEHFLSTVWSKACR